MAPAPSSPSPATRPRILPSPVLDSSQSSLQPREIQLLGGLQNHYKLEPEQPYGAWFWVLEPHSEER